MFPYCLVRETIFRVSNFSGASISSKGSHFKAYSSIVVHVFFLENVIQLDSRVSGSRHLEKGKDS